MEKRGTAFTQSVFNFPCPVSLGQSKPCFGLFRYDKPLRFLPLDDEGLDRQRFLYKGRRRSHRFTILGDASFEYDVILEREPESNTITLLIDGAENYDFFRQPDFVDNPFLQESYAVYKKETFVGEGTGKLCHIHRPEIMDARGRRCWGDLSVSGDRLTITIPEKWLSDASYPVTVDPTIGTSTVGSQYLVEYDPPRDPWRHLFFEISIPVNRFIVPEKINGLCTAYIYTDEDEFAAGGRPVLYSNNYDMPWSRNSINENFIDFKVSPGNPKGWRTGTFRSDGPLLQGNAVWFGVSCEYMWYPRFDYGAVCYAEEWEDDTDIIPEDYPYSGGHKDLNYKLSMYFTYISAQNYVRTITQGVKINDIRRYTGEYKRSLSQAVNASSMISKFKTFYLALHDTVMSNGNSGSAVSFLRALNETGLAADELGHIGTYHRGISSMIESHTDITGGFAFYAFIADSVNSVGSVFRGLILLVRIFSGVFIRDYLLGRFIKAREEIILKSCITREIVLESRIQ